MNSTESYVFVNSLRWVALNFATYIFMHTLISYIPFICRPHTVDQIKLGKVVAQLHTVIQVFNMANATSHRHENGSIFNRCV